MKVTENKVESIALSPVQILTIRLYRRLKQLEKRLADRIGESKGKIFAFHSGEFIGLEGEKKILSVSFQTKKGLDKEALAMAYPEIDLARFEKESEPFLVVRLH